MSGILNTQRQSANQGVANSTVLVSATRLSFALVANERKRFRAVLPFTLAGAVSGLKVQVTNSQASANYLVETQIYNGSTNAVALISVITAQASQSNALANAANHLVIVDGEITQGAAAGTVSI